MTKSQDHYDAEALKQKDEPSVSNENDSNQPRPKINGYTILFSHHVEQPGSITIPAQSKEEAEALLRSLLTCSKDIQITVIHDLEDAPAFKSLVAQQVLLTEQQQAAYERWLNQPDDMSASDVDDDDTSVLCVPVPGSKSGDTGDGSGGASRLH